MFVLDASITMRWFFESGSHQKADAILDSLSSGSEIALVPTIWRYEVSAVLARAQTRGSAPTQDVHDFLEDLGELPIQVDTRSRIFEHVHVIATTHRLTTYDAAYFELALRRQLPLASLDAELIAACRKTGHPMF